MKISNVFIVTNKKYLLMVQIDLHSTYYILFNVYLNLLQKI